MFLEVLGSISGRSLNCKIVYEYRGLGNCKGILPIVPRVSTLIFSLE